MRFLKSFLLMAVVNLCFVVMITAFLAAFHLHLSLAAFAVIFGFAGAFLSLFLSRFILKRRFHMQRINPTTPGVHAQLYQILAAVCAKAEMPVPQLWLYVDGRPNAFTTGITRKGAMIAMSTGLVNAMNGDQIAGVLSHELGHIHNGDMLSTTLLLGLMNSYVIWLGNLAGRYFGGNFITEFLTTVVFEMALSFLALIPITAFSRHREYAADAFSAKVLGSAPLISALATLDHFVPDTNPRKDALATAYIHGPWKGIFATHPSTEKRIKRLKEFSLLT